jgi:hypothetical protein
MATTSLPRAGSRSGATGAAPLRADGARLLQVVLFVAGAVLLPLGLIVIVLGWYGAAHTPYQYDQLAYLVSGGMLGLGLTFCGGFLYFGAWLARIAADQRETSKRLADTLLILADAVAASPRGADQRGPRNAGAVLVTTPGGTTLHRAGCALVADRDDLTPAGADAGMLNPCRVCRPGQ